MVDKPTAPLITVLLPTNGRADVIGAAIQSILAQDFDDFELMVVGDGCEDDTEKVVTSFGDGRIRWLSFPKGPGPGYNVRNLALKQARGSIVAFAQHDDLMFPDHLRLLANAMQRKNAMWAYTRPLWVDDTGLMMPFFVNLSLASQRQDFMRNRNVIPSNCVAVRRSAIEAVGGFDEKMDRNGDWQLYKQIFRKFGAGSVGVIRQVTGLHFRAKWKDNDRRWGPQPLPYLSGLAMASDDWPALLRHDLNPHGGIPQLQFATKMQENPAQFCARIRAGETQLQDALAWSASHDPLNKGG